MRFSKRMAAQLVAGALLTVAAACNGGGNGNASLPAIAPQALSGIEPLHKRDDDTSILKKLTKDVVIGSTVDPKNGDKGPHGISVVTTSYGELKKGQVLVCNFENKAGDAGDGTTVEQLDPAPGSKPVEFAQNAKFEGCAGLSISPASEDVYVAGYTSGLVAQITPKGKLGKTWGKPLVHPFSVIDAACVGGASECGYSAEYVYVTDVDTGDIVSFSVNDYGNKKEVGVISGFAVNGKSGWGALGPSGLAFTSAKKGTLFAVDGPDDTAVSFNDVTELLVPNEVVVQKGGKKFTCLYPKTSCGTLIYAGSPLDSPIPMALLPNGNLISANAAGGNTLVEMTPAGKVLDTKVVDTDKTPGIYGLYAIGTTDSNTALYYTDTNDNDLHELEQ
jgi:hypothetical protein